jgi:hypothetical protein
METNPDQPKDSVRSSVPDETSLPEPPFWRKIAMTLAGILLVIFWTFIVLIGIATIIIGILYVGCVCSGGGKF